MAGGKVKHSELRRAVRDLQHRGLLHSARWAAEQLYGLEDEAPGARDEDEATPAPAHVPATPTAPIDDDASDDEMDLGDLRDRLLHTPRAQRRCLSSDWDAVPKPCVRAVFSLAR